MTKVDLQADHVVCEACGAESRAGYTPSQSECPELSTDTISALLSQPHEWVAKHSASDGGQDGE
jgi:hypothetical protein